MSKKSFLIKSDGITIGTRTGINSDFQNARYARYDKQSRRAVKRIKFLVINKIGGNLWKC